VPRFWLARQAALALRQELGEGEMQVRVQARMDYETRTTWNVWGVVPGIDPTLKEEIVVVESYFDAISVVPAAAPGAESTAGVAALLEYARYLRDHPPGRTVVLLATGSHFQQQTGAFAFLNRHARTLALFKGRMPKRFVADSLDVERLLRETSARNLPLDTLGVQLRLEHGEQVLDDIDLERLQAQLKLRRIVPDSMGIQLAPDSLNIELYISIDLSSRSDQVGFVHSARLPAHRKFYVPIGRSMMHHAEDAAAMLGREPTAMVNLVSPIKGQSWDTYLDDETYRETAALAVSTGIVSLSMITTTDRRMVLDSPLDTPDKVNIANIARQSAMLNATLERALGDPGLFGHEWDKLRAEHKKNIPDSRVSIRGRLRLLPQRSATPNEAVPHAMVTVLNDRFFNMWRPLIVLADEDGNYQVDGLRKFKTQVRGYLADAATGDITYSTDHGGRAQKLGAFEQTLTKAETVWTTILYESESLEIHDRVNAEFHFTYGNVFLGQKILDKRGAVPRQFGFSMGDWDEQMMVLYSAPGDSLRVIDDSLVLLNNEGATDELSAQGVGFDAREARMIPFVSLQSMKDMWRLDDVRIERMRSFAIENPRLDALHSRSWRALQKAEAAMENLQWGAYIKYIREALGLEYRAYPDVRGTQNDIVSGLVFFVALLVPAAFFAERLLFAAPEVQKQLGWFAAIMFVIWVILSQVHPAFELAHPVIVLLALMVMVMAFFVITLIVGRFNTFMTDLRQREAGTASGDLSRSGTAYVAFMLGISNMRRRVTRTGLTLATITILTFTVLSFTSFKPSIQFIGFEKDWSPPYSGILFHDINWWSWEPTHYDYLQSHFQESGTLSPRTWLTMGFEEQGYIPMRLGDSEADGLGVLGLSVQEPLVTGIDRTLIAGRWFEGPQEESVILSDVIASQLGVSIEAVERGEGPEVHIFGDPWTVIGVFDGRKFDDTPDLNNEPMTPAEEQFTQFNMPGMDQMFLMNDVFFEEDVEITYEHVPASRLAIVPYERLESMGAELMSVAVRFDEGVEARELIESYLSRSSFRLFVGMPDDDGAMHTYSYSSIGATTLEGLGALVIPMLIAALIVLNTMMGAVYERFREIGVYSSVGLAPVHISFLFIAESCVYGVLGVVLGYIFGQVGAKVLLTLDLLGGVSLNYSSTSAIGSAMLVIIVVLVSSIYPARVASQMAVPDVVRRWQLPEPEGDVWRFPFPFTVNINAVESLCGYLHSYFSSYGHESVGQMYTERTRIVTEETPGERSYAVQLLLWLAPFDMGVSQYLQFTTKPTENPRILEIHLYIQRISGPVAFWQRLNLGFMLQLRKQFLVWQTLKAEIQQEHIDHCRQIAKQAQQLELESTDESLRGTEVL
jgi:ABC-type antimicrobial peptide transport system permease subunit